MKHPIETWRWFGAPGHFIGADDCRFHLCTHIGPWLVSTVGDYRPSGSQKAVTIGWNRTYETMVFRAGPLCDAAGCKCGMPTLADASELTTEAYNDAGAATKGHYEVCAKWAEKAEADAEAEVSE